MKRFARLLSEVLAHAAEGKEDRARKPEPHEHAARKEPMIQGRAEEHLDEGRSQELADPLDRDHEAHADRGELGTRDEPDEPR